MSTTRDHHCFKCGVELTTPSPIVEWSHGSSVNGGMTIEFRGGVGSEFSGFILTGVVCDACVRELASMQGRLTATYPSNVTMPVGTAMIDGTIPEGPQP